MSKVKFKLDGQAVAKMLRSPEAQALVNRAANSVALRAGEGFSVESSTYSRARAYVKPTTAAARRAAAKHALEIAAINGV